MPFDVLQFPRLQVTCKLLPAARPKPGRQVVLQLLPERVTGQL
jgi:hypothetical protein